MRVIYYSQIFGIHSSISFITIFPVYKKNCCCQIWQSVCAEGINFVCRNIVLLLSSRFEFFFGCSLMFRFIIPPIVNPLPFIQLFIYLFHLKKKKKWKLYVQSSTIEFVVMFPLDYATPHSFHFIFNICVFIPCKILLLMMFVKSKAVV